MLSSQNINVIRITNPLDHTQRVLEDATWAIDKSVSQYLQLSPYEMVVSINGKIIEEDKYDVTFLDAGDFLVICPVPQGGGGSKGILRIVAMIAIMVVAWQFAPYLIGEYGVLGATGLTAGQVAMGITIAGSMLVNALLPVKPAQGISNDGFESSQTYGIDGPKNTSDEGQVVPLCYGSFRMAGNLINSYVENIGSQQVLYLLFNAGEGVIDDITDIEINDAPISQFTNVQFEVRNGEPEQAILQWFDDTVIPRNLNTKLDSSYTTFTTLGPVDKFRLDFIFPQGLFQIMNGTIQRQSVAPGFASIANDGSIVDRYVDIEVQYRKVGDPGWTSMPMTSQIVGWHPVLSCSTRPVFYDRGGPSGGTICYTAQVPTYQPVIRFSDRSQSVVRRSMNSPALEEAVYEIRMKRLTPETGANTIADDIYISDINEVVTEDIGYNNTALLALRIELNDKITGLPRVTYINHGLWVDKFDETLQDWIHGPSNNPAWVALSLMINTRYGGGMPPDRINVSAWREWAQFCVTQGLTFDGIIDTQQSLWDVLQYVFRAGHAQIVNVGTRYTVAIEREDSPSMMFGVGNIVSGSFQQSWLPMSDRANEIEVTFYDKDDNYKQRTIRIYDPSALAIGKKQRQSSITLYGIVDAARAYAEGVLQLNLNKYLTQTVEFDAPFEAIGCSIGSLVFVQHDMPQWGYAGRLAAALNDRYLDLPGTSGNAASTPSSILNSITGDIDIRVKLALNNWASGVAQALINKNTDTGSLVSYRLDINPTGSLLLWWSPDGTLANRLSVTSTVPVGGIAGVTMWVRADMDVNDGSGNRVITFRKSTNGILWTPVGAVVTVAGVTSIFPGSAPVVVGSVNNGTLPVAGKIHYAEIRNGIDAGIAVSFNPSGDIALGTPLTWTASTGEIWNISQSGSPNAHLVEYQTRTLVLDRDVTMEALKTYKALITHDKVLRTTGTVSSITGTIVFLTGFDGVTPAKRLLINGADLPVLGFYTVGITHGVELESVAGISIGNTYELWDTDVIEERGVVNTGVTTNVIQLQSPLSQVTAQYVNWMFGEVEKVKKPFRIKMISGSGDDTRHLVALEYNAAVYGGLGDLPVPNFSALPAGVEQVTIEGVFEDLVRINNTLRTRVTVHFHSTQETYRTANVLVSKNGGPMESLGNCFDRATVEAEDGAELIFKVIAIDILGSPAPETDAPTISHTVIGKTAPPPDITDVQSEIQFDGISLTWPAVTVEDLKEYVVRKVLGPDHNGIARGLGALRFVDISTSVVSRAAPVGMSNSVMSVEMWITRRVDGDYFTLTNGWVANGWLFGITSAESLMFGIGDSGGGQHNALSNTSCPVGIPTFITGTYDGTTVRLYVNAAVQNITSSLATTTITTGGSVVLGWRANVAGEEALADGVRIYNRALSAAEILEHYQGVYNDESGLKLYWPLDEGTGTIATDMSGNGNHGTLTGSPLPTWVGDITPANKFHLAPTASLLRDFYKGMTVSATWSGQTQNRAILAYDALAQIVLLESRWATNQIANSETLGTGTGWVSPASTAVSVTANTDLAPDGTMTADTVTDSDVANTGRIQYNRSKVSGNATWVGSGHVKKTTGDPNYSTLEVQHTTGGTPVIARFVFNTNTGVIANTFGGFVASGVDLDETGTYWRPWGVITDNGTGNTNFVLELFPAWNTTGALTNVVTVTGSKVMWGLQIEQATAVGPYLRSNGTVLDLPPASTPYVIIGSPVVDRTTELTYKHPPTPALPQTFKVTALDTSGHESLVPAEEVVTPVIPSAPTVSFIIEGTDAVISWPAVASSFEIANYDLRHGVSWVSGTAITIKKALTHKLPITWLGARTIHANAIDVAGNIGTPGSTIITITIPAAPVLSQLLAGADVVLSWTTPAASLPIEEYEIRTGASFAAGTTVAIIKGNSTPIPVTWLGARTFWIAAKDVNGNYGASDSEVVTITALSGPTVSAGFVGRDVVITWTTPTGSLPVASYDVRHGASFAAGTPIAKFLGNSFTLPAVFVGARTYWVAATDTAGNVGTAASAAVTVTAPSAPVVSQTIAETTLKLSWTAPSASLPILEYEVRHGASFAAGTLVGKISGTNLNLNVDWFGSRTFWVAAIDSAGNTGTAGSTAVSVTAPTTPTVSYTINGPNLILAWTPATATLGVLEYEIRFGASFGAGVSIATIKGTTLNIPVNWTGSRTFWVAAYDPRANVGTAGSAVATFTLPSAVVLSAQVVDNNVLLRWNASTATLPIDTYQVRKGTTFLSAAIIGNINAQFATVFEEASGSYNYWVVPFDTAGNQGTEASVTATVNQPPDYVLNYSADSTFSGQPVNTISPSDHGTLTAVSGNIVTHITTDSDWDSARATKGMAARKWYWEVKVNLAISGQIMIGVGTSAAPLTTYPGAATTGWGYYGLDGFKYTNSVPTSYGATFDDGDIIGVALDMDAGTLAFYKNGVSQGTAYSSLTGALFPMVGLFRTGDNVTCNFGELEFAYPLPDGYNGLTSAHEVTAKLVLPINRTETYQAHFTTNSWAAPSDQVAAGFPIFIEPSATTAQYVEEIDYGTTLSSTVISVTMTSNIVTGTVTVTPKISVKLNIGDAWTDFSGSFSAFATTFRYIKITLDFASVGGNDLLEVIGLNIKLNVKLRNDAGMAAAVSSDVGGTTVNFNIPFIDVNSITVTPQGTTAVQAVYDFVDVPNPTSFKVLLFNTAGTRVSGNFSWSAKGV